jgi:hypothetical protein
MYAPKPARAFLCTLPGLPPAKDQSTFLVRDFWQRIAAAYCLLLAAIVLGLAGLGRLDVLGSFLTILAGGIVGARIIEARIALYAQFGALSSLLGISGPVAVVFAGVCAAIAVANQHTVGVAALALCIAAVAAFTPRAKTALALMRVLD